MEHILIIFREAWQLLLESAIYILFGLLISGLLRVFLHPDFIAKHLGGGRFKSVFKAAFFGVPIPLCSCGVLPAAAALKKQGANSGATTAFLIATPESGEDSIAATYALLDPIMTVVRPVAAVIMAVVAGVSANLVVKAPKKDIAAVDASYTVDGCCDGRECPPKAHKHHHTLFQKAGAGVKYAFGDVWNDLSGWFFLGLLFAGLITALIPDDIIHRYMGGGILAMLLMLMVGIPLYICATASTPIAAALILKGVSPGAALVFLLAGPATNITSLTVLLSILGRRVTAIYLVTIALLTILFGLTVDQIYTFFNIAPQAAVGQAAEIMPAAIKWAGAVFLLIISIKPLASKIAEVIPKRWRASEKAQGSTSFQSKTPPPT